ncbi:MAG: SLC13/DASS family transporter [Oscillatoria sp. SIO1A7]|nr:SLC13/DASS family transporter [Oscillatoria sp. SIO1A7]
MWNLLRSRLRAFRFIRKPWFGYLAAAAIYGLVLVLPMPGVEWEARLSLAVFGVAVFLWGTNILPLPVTGIIVLLLLPASGAVSHEDAYAYFGNRAVFFILGAFILSSPIVRSGLSTRIALAVVSRFGKTQEKLLASILGMAAMMSCVITAHAVAAMLFPIVLEVVRAAGVKPGGRFGLAAFLALAWGVVIGSNTTLLGGARGPLALGILRNVTGQSISFVQWMVWCFPLVVILLSIAYLLIRAMAQGGEKAEKVSLSAARRFLEARNKRLGKISKREILTAGIMVVTIGLWVTEGDTWGLDTVAFFGACSAFVLGVADWREVEEDVNWGIVLMYGSAIALSAALSSTGAASALTKLLLGSGINSPLLILGTIAFMSMAMTEFMSNAAAVAVLLPVALALAEKYGIDSRAMTLGVVVPSGLGFMLPVSTPALAIAVSSGFVRPLSVMRWGVWLDLMAGLLFIAMSQLYWPLVGLR